MLNWDFTNVGKISYFDSMTQFDFVTSFPALLRVENRGSMAHGRVSCPSLIVGVQGEPQPFLKDVVVNLPEITSSSILRLIFRPL